MGVHRRPSTAARAARNVALTGAATGGLFALSTGTASASTVEDFEKLADCETGDVSKPGYQAQWDYNGPSGFGGGLQFSPATWTSITRGENLPQYAWQASKEDQIRMADKLLAQVARETGSVERAWATQFPACSKLQGLRGVQPGLQAPAPPPPVDEPPTDPVPAQPQPTPGNEAPTDPIPAQQSVTILVEPGDWLSTIARDKIDGLCEPGSDIRECWKPLYEQNRALIGPNPDAIFPGMRLTFAGNLVLPGGPPVTVPDDVVEPTQSVEEPPPAAPRAGVVRPTAGPVTSEFGGARNHKGLDFDGVIGDRVNAATDGIVTSVEIGGYNGGWGGRVEVTAPDGTVTAYNHLSAATVSRNEVVVAGQQIAKVGNTGRVISRTGDGSHLDFQVIVNGKPINPRPWLESRGVRV